MLFPPLSLFRRPLLALGIAMLSPLAVASSPWVAVGDTQARHHIEALQSAGCLDGLTVTWPISWSAVISAYRTASASADPGAVRCHNRHGDYLLSRYKDIKADRAGVAVRVGGSNQEMLFRDFAGGPVDELSSDISLYGVGKHWAGRLTAQYVEGDRDSRRWRADGSYLAGLAGNWQLGVGAIDRWWGPGWYSSLSLSNNARPVPGVWLSRQVPHAPESRWLSWVGPWDLQMIAGQLEQDRAIPDAKLLGARLVFRPHANLQLGMTRLIQWGGEGRRQDLSSLWEAFLGRTNGESDGFTPEEGQGNQLAGFDFRLSLPFQRLPVGVYGDFIGEDEAGYMPAKYATLVGVDALTGIGKGSQRFIIEYTDTIAGLWGSEQRNSVMYEHSTYLSGYRHHGRNMASSWESDAQALTLGLQQHFLGGTLLSLDVSAATLNKGGTKRAFVHSDAPEIVQADGEQDIVLTRLRLEHDLAGGRLSWMLNVSDEPVLTYFSERERVTAGVQWTRNFNF